MHSLPIRKKKTQLHNDFCFNFTYKNSNEHEQIVCKYFILQAGHHENVRGRRHCGLFSFLGHVAPESYEREKEETNIVELETLLFLLLEEKKEKSFSQNPELPIGAVKIRAFQSLSHHCFPWLSFYFLFWHFSGENLILPR